MIRKFTASVLLAVLAMGAVHAAESVETALEVTAGSLTLPTNPLGNLVMKGCSSCTAVEFEITPATTFEVGETFIRLDEMRRVLAQRSREVLLLQLTPDRKHVARIYIAPARQ